MNVVLLSLKIFFRELKSGQLLLMFLSLTLAVGIVASITLFTDRLDRSLIAESQVFLGGDLKFETSDAIEESNIPNFEGQFAKIYEFGSVVSNSDNFQLAAIKSVEEPYPIAGQLEIINENSEVETFTSPPNPGEIWLDGRLAGLLDISIGDQVDLGATSLIYIGTIFSEADRGTGSFAFAPKAIMNSADLESTQLIRSGSRVRYTYLFTASKEDIDKLEQYFQNIKRPGDDILTPQNEETPLGRAIDRASNFFLLGALLAIILSSLAIAISSLQFTRRHTEYVAIFKALGFQPKEIRITYLLIFTFVAIFSILFGIATGWFVQLSFLSLLKEYFPANLPLPGPNPYFISIVTAFTCLLGFAYPMLRNLFELSPNTILRKTANKTGNFLSIVYSLSGLLAFYFLIVFFIRDFYITNIIFFSILAFALFIFGFIYLIFSFIKPLGLNPLKTFKMIAFELSRRKLFNSLQIVSITVAIALSLIAYSSSTNIISSWESSLPEKAPNNFIFNLFEDEKENLKDFLESRDIELLPIYPVTSARFFRVGEGEDIDRTFNFTWMEDLPEGNKIVSGEWFNQSSDGVSISIEIAERYNLKLNDEIEIDVAGKRISSFIQSIREVNWENFSPNFFAIGNTEDFSDLSPTYITSFHVPENKKIVTTELIKQFPTSSVISLENLIQEIQSIISKVSQALSLILGLTLLSALFLVLATIQESYKQREKQNAILKTLGLSRTIMQKNTFLEYLTIGLFAGGLGGLLALIATYLIETFVFEIDPTVYWDILLLGILSAVVIIGIISAIFTFYLSTKTPKDVFSKVS